MKPLLYLTLALLPLAAAAQNDDAGQKGYDIAARSDRSDRGFGDSAVELEMVLRNAAGAESRRSLKITTLEVPDESLGDKSLVVFDSPKDIDGTALLSYAKIIEPDDQWLYLPALKRIKRISSANKSGPFVGSEFAFEDFTAQELNKYKYRYLRTGPCGDAAADLQCDVVERIPRYENSGYSKQIGWTDTTHYQTRKVEFYDRKGDLLKTLKMLDYKQYDDQYWRSHRFEMLNHQTGKSTDLIYGPYTFKTGLDDGDFVKGVLKRVR